MLKTIMLYWIAASYVIGIGLTIEQLRRPASDWEAAGRERRFWVALTFIFGFHGLGQYAAAAYLVGVAPRFPARRPTGARRALARAADASVRGWRRARGRAPAARELGTAKELVIVAALLVFAASFIHSAVISEHFEEFWLSGVFFVVVTFAQALWTALVCTELLDRRLLVAGIAINAAVVAVWALSRTIGVPLLPEGGREAVGEVDVIATMDEVCAIVLLALVVARLRAPRPPISRVSTRLATALAGPLFIWSVFATFGGGYAH